MIFPTTIPINIYSKFSNKKVEIISTREGYIIPSELKKVRTPKTVYDQKLISDKKMLQWAMKSGKIEGRKITGTSKNGLKFEGYMDETTGEIKNFFPTLR